MPSARHLAVAVPAAALAASLAASVAWPALGWVAAASAAVLAVGVRDLTQTRHSVLRNYPVLGRFRYMFESVRPEIRQYLIEGDRDELPFSRAQRALVYARAKGEQSDLAFGTLVDVRSPGHEFMAHSMRPVPHPDPAGFRTSVGGPDCSKPYSASVLNISAMSFGSLSANAIKALNSGAAKGGFYHDTGEGGISPHHLSGGGDLVWEIGSGYFGCRDERGGFDPERFRERASDPAVKMVEIKLSQGAKPGHGGILPGRKVTAEIAQTRGVPVGVECVSPSSHSAFSTPVGLMEFVVRLRELSGGKPVGFKLCVGHPWEFMAIAKAMVETGISPDFVVVDGAEGGTGAAPVEFADHLGMPAREGLVLVRNVLVGAGLRDRVRIASAGKVVSAFDVARVLSLGADWANSGRGFMFSLGCIQSLSCHRDTCPTGVATQDPSRQRGLVVADKSERVAAFHRNTMKALSEMIAAAGVSSPTELGPHHMARRVSPTEIKLFSQVHAFLAPGELLAGPRGGFWAEGWKLARADSFAPAA